MSCKEKKKNKFGTYAEAVNARIDEKTQDIKFCNECWGFHLKEKS